MDPRGRAAASIVWLILREATRRLDGDQLVEVEIEDGLQGLAGGGVAQRFGQRLEPSHVVALHGDELSDRVAPALMAAAAIEWSPEADDRGAGMACAIARLTLGAGQRLVALRLASPGHGPSGFRHVTQLPRFQAGGAAPAGCR